MKIKKLIILLFSFFLVLPCMSGQEADERIVLWHDRDIYISGEHMFFSCRLIADENIENRDVSKYGYILIRNTENNNVVNVRIKFTGNYFTGALYLPDTLQTGYYQLVAFTNFMKNFSEELFFKEEFIVANRFDASLESLNFSEREAELETDLPGLQGVEIVMNKQKFVPREKVELDLSFPGKEPNFRYGSFCVIMKGTRLEKRITEAGNEFTQISDPAFQKESPNTLFFHSEHDGIYYYGKVVDDDNKPVKNEKVFLSAPDTVANLLYSVTNENGDFSFLLTEYYFGKEVFFNLENDESGKLILEDRFLLESHYKPSSYAIGADSREKILLAQEIVKVQKAFPVEVDIDVVLPDFKYIPLAYSDAANIIHTSEYVSLPDFIEISREILPGVRTRSTGDGYKVSLKNIYTDTYFDELPAIFIDGVKVQKIDPVISLSSDDIIKIEYINKERFIGDLVFPGIISILTGVDLVKSQEGYPPGMMVSIPLNFPVCKSFDGYTYDNLQNLMMKEPDFRQLLFWDGQLIKRDNDLRNVEFYTSDIEGAYVAIFRGYTADGRCLMATKEFKVQSDVKK